MKIFSNRTKFFAQSTIVFSCMALLAACSDDSATNPADTPDIERVSYAVSIDEEKSQLTIGLTGADNACIYRNSAMVWDTLMYTYDLTLDYVISNHELTMTSEEVNYPTLYSESNTSIYGEWWQSDSSSRIIFTNDSALTYGKIEEEPEPAVSDPVETPITLENSTFLYTLFRCITEERYCKFSQHQFSMSRSDENALFVYEYDMNVLGLTSNSINFTYNDREFSVNVEHVQDDSLNNGRAYYSAYVVIDSDTCRYEYIRSLPTEELCTDDNKEYFTGYYRDEDLNIECATIGSCQDSTNAEENAKKDFIIWKYLKTNSSEFGECIRKHTENQ